MKKVLIIFTIIIASCNNDKIENIKILALKKENDSLKLVINQLFDPIIIENNKNKELKSGDSANFIIGLLMNNERIIESINMTLYKVGDDDSLTKLNKDVIYPNKQKERSYGISHFQIPNLQSGYYLYRGFIFFNNKKLSIEHFFEVK